MQVEQLGRKNFHKLKFLTLWALVGLGAAGSWAANPTLSIDLTITAAPRVFSAGAPGEEFFLSWSAPVDVTSATALNTYYILSSEGGTSPLTVGTTIAVLTDDEDVSVILTAASRSFVVRASNTYSGLFAQSEIITHYFMDSAGCAGDGSFVLSDAAGGQIGFGQQWLFKYFMMNEAQVSLTIYSTATTFASNGSGYMFPATNTTPVKSIINNVPRPGAGASCSVRNTEIWDSRNSSGVLVSNGFYLAHFMMTNPLLSGTTLYAGIFAIPVDVLRFTNFSTLGISESNSLANVNYTITGDAEIRIVVARPGRRMVLDSNGDVQSLDSTNASIDTSTNSVVQIFTFNRKAGSYTETWSGTDQFGVAVASGIYSVGISGRDSYNNRALGLANNDGPLVGNIPIDRTASQTAIDTLAPSVSSVTIDATTLDLTQATVLYSSFTSITIGLSEPAGTGSNTPQVTLSNPFGNSVAGNATTLGTDIIFTPTTIQSSTGTYTLYVTPRDAVGNVGTTKSVSFVVTSGTAPASADIVYDMTLSVTAVPTVFKNGLPGESFFFSWFDVTFLGDAFYLLASSGPSNPLVYGTTIAVSTDFTFWSHNVDLPAGTWSFMIQEVSTLTKKVVARSNVSTHYFLSSTLCAGDGTMKRRDSVDGQEGFGQQWKFNYTLMQDAELTVMVYSTAAVFSSTVNSRGFVLPVYNIAPVKVLVDHVPRPGALDSCSVGNEEIWDARDSSGAVVSNGFYFIYSFATNPLYPGTTLYSGVFSVPVDVLRFTKFTTDGISIGDSLANISYRITGDATVRILIARPGRKLVIDSNGDIQALNAAGTAVDTGTNSVVQVLTFNRKAGSYDETWNGTDLAGVAVSTGLYPVGISARDNQGNRAMGISNDDGSLVGVIPLDRTASQKEIDSTPPSVTTVTVGGIDISLSATTVIYSSFTSIVIGLDEPLGTGENAPTVSLMNPAGSPSSGTVSVNGSVITLSLSAVQLTSGTYTLSVSPRDAVGNIGISKSFTFILDAGTAPLDTSELPRFDLTVNALPIVYITGLPGEAFTIVWTLPAVGGDVYYVMAASGPSNPMVSGTTVAVVANALFTNLNLPPGTWSFIVQAFSNSEHKIVARTDIETHYFLSNSGCSGNGSFLRGDSAGGQLGFGQTWNFEYLLMHDAEITVAVYSTATVFSSTVSRSGFVHPIVNPIPIKTVVDRMARSGALADCDVSNKEIWDSRDSSGTIVPNGFYYVYFKATNPLFPGTTLYTGVLSVPIDILRFTAFDTVGISEGGSLASIKYTITGDAAVRILIARPGRRMVLDSNGDIQSLNAAGTAIDTSTDSVVQTLIFNRKAGTYSESWNGTESNSVAASSGIYVVGISARDSFGNKAIGLLNDDGPMVGSIPVDRTASQTATDTTAPSVAGVTIGGNSISLTGATVISNSFSSIIIVLDETAGTGSNAPTVSLVSSTGTTLSGTLSISASSLTYTLSSTVSSTGTYTLSVTPRDASGNVGSLTSVTFLLQEASSGGSGSSGSASRAETFRNSVYAYPNPVKSAPLRVRYDLDRSADVEFDVFNLLGERVYHVETSGVTSGAQTLTWNLVNDASSKIGSGIYIYRLRTKGSDQVEATKKVVVVQ
ncbi:MAG: T9SS type A sorting domain-containing protein [Elusimicrobia bacterium]|nr:T9SS type A sorting domain-containing protein [Elusimicrobiota bacterium]